LLSLQTGLIMLLTAYKNVPGKGIAAAPVYRGLQYQ
jgi:hypothetical protein